MMLAMLRTSLLAVLLLPLIYSPAGAVCSWTDVDGSTRSTCVNTTNLVEDCLLDAETDARHNIVRVVQGTYTGNFDYTAGASENFDLEISGGWNTDCTVQSPPLAGPVTLLDGDAAGVTFSFDAGSATGTLWLENLNIAGGSNALGKDGGCVEVYTGAGAVFINRNIITGCAADNGAGIFVQSDSGAVAVTNNVVYLNTAASMGGGIAVESMSGSQVYVVNNTIDNNEAGISGGGVAIWMWDSVNSTADIQNNIIWGNVLSGSTLPVCNDWGFDVYIDSDPDENGSHAAFDLGYNLIDTDLGLCATNLSYSLPLTNINAAPQYDTIAGDYHIQDSSPAVNAGNSLHPLFESFPELLVDIDGQDRTNSFPVDIGADESSVILPATGVTLKASPLSPQPAGMRVRFTAEGLGGTGQYQYKFQWKLATDTKWTLGRVYTKSSTWTWNTTGLAAGDYKVRVRVRSLGTTTPFDQQKSRTYTLTIPPATGVTLSADPTSPQPSGMQVTFTAGGQGGTGQYQYKFQWKLATDTKWTLGRAYKKSQTWIWDTTGLAAGDYKVRVRVRSLGTTATFDKQKILTYTLTIPTPATGVTLSAVPSSSQPSGTQVTFTAGGQGGTGQYQYKFQWKLATDTKWTLGRIYKESGTWVWDTTGLSAGNYRVRVLVRTLGTTSPSDATKWIPYVLTGP